MSIFGAAYDVSADRWVAFNEDTLTSLSEHDTEAEAWMLAADIRNAKCDAATFFTTCLFTRFESKRRLFEPGAIPSW